MRSFFNSKGLTLIELVISMVVMSVALMSLVAVFSTISVQMQSAEFLRTARMLAQEQVEEIRARRFDENASKDGSGNWSTAMGADAGETATDKNTFDDVDDFHGWSENLTGSFSSFSRSVSISYVSVSSPDTPLAIPAPVPANWTPNYKRVQVTCSTGQTSVQLVSLIGVAQKGG